MAPLTPPVPPSLQAPLVEWAQYYAALGWPVFPCRGKFPAMRTAHPEGDPLRGICHGECGQMGHGLYDATTDPFQVDIWWKQEYPGANIGCACGVEFWALDIDPRSGGDATLFYLTQQYGQLPTTLLSHTGRGGDHLVWRLPQGIQVINKAPVGDGIDVQGVGSYIILPPSMHPDTGKPYVWDLQDGPDDIMPQDAPEWLLSLVTAAQPVPPAPAPAPATPVLVDAPILEGKRNKTLYTYGSGAARAGWGFEAIVPGLRVINQRCVPPLSDLEVERIARSASSSRRAIMLALPAAQASGMNDTGKWGTPPPAPQLSLTDFADMLEREYPLPTWLIEKLIPEGLVFFIGSPKSSKTYLAYSLALALAYGAPLGSKWFDHYPIMNSGPVVYITIEDDEADSRLRMAELAPHLTTVPRNRLLFVHGENFPRFDQGLVDVLRDQVLERYHPVLVVLDPISYLYAPLKRQGDQFSEVRDMLLPLRWLGRRYHCTIAGVDHRRKQTKDDIDIFETQYGSVGKSAIADAMYIIVRDQQEITVHARIRKAPDQTLSLTLEFHPNGTAVWTLKGAVDGLVGLGQYNDLRQQVLNALSGSDVPLSIQDLLAGLNIPDSRQTRNNVYQILFRAQKSHEVQKTTRGQYVWAGGN